MLPAESLQLSALFGNYLCCRCLFAQGQPPFQGRPQSMIEWHQYIISLPSLRKLQKSISASKLPGEWSNAFLSMHLNPNSPCDRPAFFPSLPKVVNSQTLSSELLACLSLAQNRCPFVPNLWHFLKIWRLYRYCLLWIWLDCFTFPNRTFLILDIRALTLPIKVIWRIKREDVYKTVNQISGN